MLDYPAQGEFPTSPTMSACEVLTWIGYRRAIPKDAYLDSLQYRDVSSEVEAPRHIWEFAYLYEIIHTVIPDPKPDVCPMENAQKKLIEALRAGRLRSVSRDEATDRVTRLTPQDFEFALVLDVWGLLQPDLSASADAQALAYDRVQTGVSFFTSEVLSLWSWPPDQGIQSAVTVSSSMPAGAKERAPSTPGPKPKVTYEIAQRMISEYAGFPEKLEREPFSVLGVTYKQPSGKPGNNDTLRKARVIALAQLRQNSDQTPNNDK